MITRDSKGSISWTHQTGDRYIATGEDRNGKRFSISSTNWHHIRGINIYRGSKWLERNGKRTRLASIFN